MSDLDLIDTFFLKFDPVDFKQLVLFAMIIEINKNLRQWFFTIFNAAINFTNIVTIPFAVVSIYTIFQVELIHGATFL